MVCLRERTGVAGVEADEMVVWGLGSHGDSCIYVWKLKSMKQARLVVEV